MGKTTVMYMLSSKAISSMRPSELQRRFLCFKTSVSAENQFLVHVSLKSRICCSSVFNVGEPTQQSTR